MCRPTAVTIPASTMDLRNQPSRLLYRIVSRPPDYPRHSQWRLMWGGGENTSSSPGLGCHHKLLNLWWILHHQRWWIVTGCIIDDPSDSLSPETGMSVCWSRRKFDTKLQTNYNESSKLTVKCIVCDTENFQKNKTELLVLNFWSREG